MRCLLLVASMAVIGVAVYFGLTRGVPYLERIVTNEEVEAVPEIPTDDPAVCVEFTASAAATVADQVRQFARPPVDSALWAAALVHAAGELNAAETACGCETAACAAASLALAESRRLLNQQAGALQSREPFPDPAAAGARIDSLVAQARAGAL